MALSSTLQKVKDLVDKGIKDAGSIAEALGCKKSSVYSYLSRLRKELGQTSTSKSTKPASSSEPRDTKPKVTLHRDLRWNDIVPTLREYIKQKPVEGSIKERVDRLFADYCAICKRPSTSYCSGCPLKFMIDNYLNLDEED